MTASFFDFTMSHARLAILRALTEAVQHTANDSTLFMEMERLGLPVTRDQLRTQLGWLEEQGLIRLSRPTDSLLAVTLRERGADVAVGRSFVDGIQRPSPGR
ncbi:ArsR family transcriptional regulator [Sphingomonas sp. CROZ-RG-20F-R02-07]|uniref:VpaChn25_0724 family phage protein n=1 Tax=Sphingomonas sp. CROZ-RG-20F-R02-07 TaxID=2914832 RepID=UPI001F588077|nr:ArsR family transcriptional regulator [Sphingomonas sp. CROZ-RG-20F-R02-07]